MRTWSCPLKLSLILLALLSCLAQAQTLDITNGVHKLNSLNDTVVTMTGRAELHLTAAATPISGCTIHLNSIDAWVCFPNLLPSVVASSSYMSQIRVNGANAVADSNVRVVQYGMGAVVIPHAANFQPMRVFSGPNFTGTSMNLNQYTAYAGANLGAMDQAISSFRLKRGYTATVAQNVNGTGISRNYVAQDGDLDVSILPGTLDDRIRFVRVFPWRWVSKKGIAGGIWQNLKVGWYYNWNLNENSTRNVEYVPIRQTRFWPGLNQNWQTRGANHLLGYNEPDNPDQDAYSTVEQCIASWPDLLATGLRVGSPAVTDGGLGWLYSFIDQADAAGLRVDYVAVHYYRCFGNANDPDGATTQFYNYLKGIHDRVKRPLWIKEWNNGANWTGCADPSFAQQQATIAKMIEMLDNTPFVERYALYNWVEDVRRVQWDNGSLTAAGETYRDKVSPFGYPQEGLPGGGRNIARFQFENDVIDSSGFGNNGIAVGVPDFTAGQHGDAVQLDGTNSYVQLPSNTAHSAGFTFAGWVFWDGGGNWQRIFDFGNDTTQYLFLTPSSGDGTLRFAIRNGGGEQMVETAALPIGQWRHVAVTLGGNTARLYINGVLASSGNMTIAPSAFNPRRNYLGKSQFAADPLFRGRLDEVILTHYPLSTAEIAALQTNQPPEFLDIGDGTWTANANGNWSDAARWSGGLLANGAGFTADFGTLNITANRVVTLDSDRTIGTLRFGDTSGAQNWTVTGSGDNVLRLDAGAGASPSIVVNQNVATLAATVAGTSGFTKSGPGTLSLAASNLLSGALNLDRGIDGNNNDGATRIAHPDAAANVTALSIRNTSVGTAGGATLQLDGSAGDIALPQTISVTCRNNSTTPTIQNLAGTNILSGSILLNVGGNMFNIQSDAGLLVMSGTNRYVGSLPGGRTYAFSGAGDHLVSGPIFNSVNGAPISLSKSGTGTLTLGGVNTYANTTTVSAGTLLVDGTVGLSPVTVSGTATLGGRGVIRGGVTIQSGATLAPGDPLTFGTLTVSNSVTLQSGSTTRIAISHAPLTNGQVRVTGALSRGGTLLVTNVAGALEAGDRFRLYNAALASGSFSSVILPALAPGLRWNTNELAATGTISVFAAAPPSIAPHFDGTSLVLQFHGEAGFDFILESTTNLVPPVIWSPEQTNQGAGSPVSFEMPVDLLQRDRYYRVRVQ